MWTENFSYPELFEYAHVILSYDLSSQISLAQKFDMADNTMFSALLTIISSLIAYLELSIALVHMNIVRQRIRNNFRQSLMSKDTRKATRRSQPYKQRRFWTRPGRTSAWWDNFVNEVVVAEEWRENFRMYRGSYHGLNVLFTGACSKRDKAVAPPIKRCSVDAEHIIRFHMWTENFCSFFEPKVAFSNLSGIVWMRPKTTLKDLGYDPKDYDLHSLRSRGCYGCYH